MANRRVPGVTAAEPLPWERRADETGPAYEAFKAYRDAGAGGKARSLRDAYLAVHPGAPPRRQSNWHAWAYAHDWEARVDEFDRHVERVKRVAFEAAARRDVEGWVKKQAELRDRVYAAADRLLRHVEVVAQFPPVETTRENGATGAVEIFRALPLAQARLATAMLRDLAEIGSAVAADGRRTAEEVAGTAPDPAQDRRTLERAERELNEWKQKMIAAQAGLPAALPPPGAPPVPEV